MNFSSIKSASRVGQPYGPYRNNGRDQEKKDQKITRHFQDNHPYRKEPRDIASQQWSRSASKLGEHNLSLKQAKSINECNFIFKNIINKGLKPDHFTYITLISNYLRTKENDHDFLKVANEIFSSLCKNNIPFYIDTYTSLITLATREPVPTPESIDKAIKFFELLLQDNLKPNDYTYGAII